jgi:hypothetical protein
MLELKRQSYKNVAFLKKLFKKKLNLKLEMKGIACFSGTQI